jgi:hypothetical protein
MVGVGFIMLACTPKYDWRDVRHDEARWKATFPGKPVEVSRSLTLPDTNAVVTLTLRSAKIDNNLFAVGWIANTAKNTAGHLEAAMLANIAAAPESIRRNVITKNGQTLYELRAKGKMPVAEGGTRHDANLWMRTITFVTPATGTAPAATHVIEILALGPSGQLRDTDAELFIESLTLLQ